MAVGSSLVHLYMAGESVDRVVKSCSQGSLYVMLCHILKEDKSFSVPEMFLDSEVPSRGGMKLPALSGISAEVYGRLRSVGASGPMSRETSKLQAYLPALQECRERCYFPPSKAAFDTVVYLLDTLYEEPWAMLDFAPMEAGEICHNGDPFGKMNFSRADVKRDIEAWRLCIAVAAHFQCARSLEFMSHADMTNIQGSRNTGTLPDCLGPQRFVSRFPPLLLHRHRQRGIGNNGDEDPKRGRLSIG